MRRPKPVLYDSLGPIENCTACAKNMRKIFDSFKCNVSYNKILSTKVLSHFYVVCFGKGRFCKHSHVNTLDLLSNWHPVLLIDKRA